MRARTRIYFRGMEERNHHSLVLKRGSRSRWPSVSASRSAARRTSTARTPSSSERQLPAEFVEVPFQGRTLHATDTPGQSARALLQDGPGRAHPAAVRPLSRLPSAAHRPLQLFVTRRAGFDRLLCRARLPPDRVHRERRCRAEDRGRLDAPQGRRARHRLHQRARAAPAPFRLLGAGRAQHHPPVRRDGDHRLPRQHGARAGPARHLPTRSSSTCATPTATASSSMPRTISPSIPTSSRSAGRCAIRGARRCGARPRRESGSRKAATFPGTPVLPPVHELKPIVAD